MPTLQFKGKNTIWNHHLSIPYHTLDEVESLDYKPKDSNGNLIIEGDNLLALKSLLPGYRGKIKCIYIDPPYNTGNENWVYNDNVNNPLMKEWLGKVVGKDDLTKHDKWLCMMTPRLKLLRELLSDEGAIFVSIDNNEYQHLKNILDEIFNENDYVGSLIWRKKEGGGQTDKYFVTEHEFLLVYQKSGSFKWINEEIPLEELSYSNKDENGIYNLVKLAKWGNAARKEDRPKMHFPIVNPDKKKIYPKAPDGSDGRWRVGRILMSEIIENNLIEWKKRDNEWIPYEKVYFNETKERVIKERSILYEIANTSEASKELTYLFGKKDVFENSKPVELIKLLIYHSTNSDSIILDSFAGSGTTAQAVMDLNAEDGGKRKFILIQMKEDTRDEPNKNICRDITRERVKRAIDKYNYKSGFKYLRVGIPIDAETMLSGNLPDYKQLARFAYYLCTGENLSDMKGVSEKNYFVGNYGSQAIYLIYKKDFDTLKNLALTLELAEKFKKENKKKRLIVYAPACFLDEEYLKDNQISYVSIPYNLFERV